MTVVHDEFGTGMTVEQVNRMTYVQMLELRRFAPSGHWAFHRGSPVADAFEVRFRELERNMTPEQRAAASRIVGWERP